MNTPSTGISITLSVEATGGRSRAIEYHTAWAKPKISTALKPMAPQVAVGGAVHWSRSNSRDNTVSNTLVMAVIQKQMVSVGTGSVVRRSRLVPSAQVIAAISASSTPTGLPARWVNSYQSSKTTPSAAAATPAQARGASRLPNTSAPSTAEKIGML